MQEIIIDNHSRPLFERGDDLYSWRVSVDLSGCYDLGEGTILQRTIGLKEVLANECANAIFDEEHIKNTSDGQLLIGEEFEEIRIQRFTHIRFREN